MQSQHSSKMIQLEHLNDSLTPNITWVNFTLGEKGDFLDCTNVCINLLQQKCILYTIKVILVANPDPSHLSLNQKAKF